MARRRLTVKRIDPWSVLKFGAVVNLAMLAVGLLVLGVVFYIIDRLALIDQACELAFDVGFTACGLNTGNLFRAMTLLGLLGVIILTAVLVFLSFLHNLIADLTGGLTFTVVDDNAAPTSGNAATATMATSAGQVTSAEPAARPPTSPTSAGRDRGGDRGRSRPATPRRVVDAPHEGRRDDGDGERRDEADRTAAVSRPARDGSELFGGR